MIYGNGSDLDGWDVVLRFPLQGRVLNYSGDVGKVIIGCFAVLFFDIDDIELAYFLAESRKGLKKVSNYDTIKE